MSKVKLIAVTQGAGDFEGRTAEDIIVYAARVSSAREDKFENPAGLLAYCIRNRHWSIFEQASMTVEITTSRAIGTQLLRHRSFQFQERSQRYIPSGSLEPKEFRLQAEKNRQSSTVVAGIITENEVDGDPELLEFLHQCADHQKEGFKLYRQALDRVS